MQLASGTIIDERYEIISVIGMGGFGTVYKANQLTFDRIVALKVMYGNREYDTEVVARFEREAKVLSTLKHRNLVIFYGFGVWDDAPYMAMEYLAGASLQSVIVEKGRLSVKESIDIAKQICQALTCAHANGIVHRDLKPSNIMVCPSDQGDIVKLIDFGLAKLVRTSNDREQRLTEAGSTVGTAQFMSPEQCLGEEIDRRSDIYSVGCMFQRCLTGEAPFSGEHSIILMNQHVHDPPALLSDFLAPEATPAGTQDVLDRALAKSRMQRYQSAEEMGRDLDLLAKEEVTAASSGGSVSSSRSSLTTSRRFGNGLPFFFFFGIVAGAAALLIVCLNWTYMTKVQWGRNSRYYLSQALKLDDRLPNSQRDDVVEAYVQALQQANEDLLLRTEERISVDCRLARLYLNSQRDRFAVAAALEGIIFKLKYGKPDAEMIELCGEYADANDKLKEYDKAIAELRSVKDWWKAHSRMPADDIDRFLADSYKQKIQPDKFKVPRNKTLTPGGELHSYLERF